MLNFRDKYRSSGSYSQNGEQGIIDEALVRLGPNIKSCVEYGASNGLYCSNTRHLLERGWVGLMVEADAQLFSELTKNVIDLPKVKIKCDQITPSNINGLFSYAAVLSIDTDGDNDFFCFSVLQRKPPMVIIEINSGLLPDDFIVSPNAGANYGAMVRLGLAKEYFLLCHTGNLIFIDDDFRDLFPEVIGDGLTNRVDYFDTKWLK